MKKVEVVNGWFYIDGKFIVPFEHNEKYYYNVTNQLIRQDTHGLLANHDVLDRVEKIKAVLPLEAVFLNDSSTLESVTIDRIELHSNQYRFQIISNERPDTFWLVSDLYGFFSKELLLEMQTYKLAKTLNELYKENYDLTLEKKYTIKLFGDFKDRGFGETRNDK